MAMGIKRPGFQLLSLAPPALRREGVSYADAPCALPDQLATYLRVYIPFGVLSMFIVAISQFVSFRGLKSRSNLKHSVDYGMGDDDDFVNGHRSRPSFRLTPNLRTRRDASESDSSSGLLPTPVSASRRSISPSFSSQGDSKVIGFGEAMLRRIPRAFDVSGPSSHSRLSRRPRGRLVKFLCDVRDVAVWPLGLFVLITWWFS
jgi:hypothetical protein